METNWCGWLEVFLCIFVPQFCENNCNDFKVIERTNFQTKHYKGMEFCKPYAYCLMMLCICIKFHDNIFHSFKVKEWTYFHTKKLQRGIIVSNVGGGRVLDFCTLSDHALYLYQVLWKYQQRNYGYRVVIIRYWKLQRASFCENCRWHQPNCTQKQFKKYFFLTRELSLINTLLDGRSQNIKSWQWNPEQINIRICPTKWAYQR